MILHYLKITWRNLLRYRMQSCIGMMGIAIGFATFLLSGYWYYWEYNFDNFHPESERIYAVTTSGMRKAADGTDAEQNILRKADAAYFSTSLPEAERSCTVFTSGVPVTLKGSTHFYNYLLADTSFFSFFLNTITDGGYRSIAPGSRAVFLTGKMAKQFFGTTQCIGQAMNIGTEDDPFVMQVAGLVKPYPGNTELIYDFIWIGDEADFKYRESSVYLKLKAGISPDTVRRKVAAHKSLHTDPFGIDEPANWKFNLRSLAESHIYCHKELRNRFRNINILAIAGLLIFISALLNHLVLFIGQQQKKQKQKIVYTGIGATRISLLLKGATELIVPILIAFMGSLCLIELLFPFFEQYTAIAQSAGMHGGGITHLISKHELFTQSFVLMGYSLIIILAISLPLISLLNINALLFRRSFIIGQIMIGSLFFLSSLTLYRQLQFMKHSDKGFSLENMLQIEITHQQATDNLAETMRNELKQCSGIEDMTLTVHPILSESGDFYGEGGCFIDISGRDKLQVKSAGNDKVMYVEQNFASFFRIPVIAGTDMIPDTDSRILINETGARTLGVAPVINQPSSSGRVISGIIQDYKYCPMQYPIQKVFFMQRHKGEEQFNPYRYIYINYMPGQQKEVSTYVQALIKKYDTSDAITCLNPKEIIHRFNKPEEIIFSLFCTLAFLCILISSFGIYCLVSLTTEQRRKEIAIRKVNGATVRNILHLFSLEYLMLTVAGNMIALPLGYLFMKRGIETYAYHTSLPWWIFITVFISTSAIVYLSVAGQVRKKTKENPAEALKRD